MVSAASHAEAISGIGKHFPHKSHSLEKSMSGLSHKGSLFSHADRIQILSGASIAFAQKSTNLLGLKSEDQLIYLSQLLVVMDLPDFKNELEEITSLPKQEEYIKNSFGESLIDNDSIDDDYSTLETPTQNNHYVASNDNVFINKFEGVEFAPINTEPIAYTESILVDDSHKDNDVENTLENIRNTFDFQGIDIRAISNNLLENDADIVGNFKLTNQADNIAGKPDENGIELSSDANNSTSTTLTNSDIDTTSIVIFIIVDNIINQNLNTLLNQANTDVSLIS